MPRYRLATWQDIENDFSDTLLLGNGASVALDDRFQYGSLLQEARRLRLITPVVNKVFSEFYTNDFEQIMNLLLTANIINRMLRIRDRATKRAYNSIRETLIRVVQAVHPERNAIVQHCSAIAGFVRHFSLIISLNYDLLLYWSFLWANEDRPSIKFKDCFPNARFDFQWERYKETIGRETKSIPVFYPHGNLALVTDIDGNERKITSGNTGQYLLTRIVQEWERGTAIPLFVSEGSSEQKLRAIHRSPYLATVYDSVLPSTGPSIVIYGSALQENDAHILRALIRGRVRRVAVSIHRPSIPDWQELCAVIEAKIRSFARIHHRRVSIIFFDAESQGAWFH